MSRYKVTELGLVSAPLPIKTDTYTPLPNREIISKVKETISGMNMRIIAEEYAMDRSRSVFTGRYTIEGMMDNGINMMMAWINSYDKTKKFAIGAGGVVIVCSNGMFIADLVEMTKHTTHVMPRFEKMVEDSVQSLDIQLNHLVQARKELETVKVDNRAINEILGRMFFEQSIVTTEQANIIKNGITNDKNFNLVTPGNKNLWSIYNLTTEALKISHPRDYYNAHLDAYKFMKDQIEIIG